MLDAVLALNETDTQVFDFAPQAAPPADEPGGPITVPDAHLLFNGEFKRVGTSDLKIVGDDGESFFIRDYFAADKLSHLISPEGATLSASVVAALAGPLAPGQSAQAGAQPAGQPVIGRVDALSGSCNVIRNGVSVELNIGDTVRKGDVVQTAGGSAVAIVFTDGSTFSLNANARMALDEFVYNAGGAGNSALISLVQGTFSFVAGQVAKTGDMRVDTPVATMGIRGTAVLVEISANDGETRFSVMAEPDGTTGSFNLYDKSSGALIGSVSNSQIGWLVTPAGPLQVVAQQLQKTPAQLAQELSIVQQVFTIYNNNQQNPFTPDPNDPGRRGDNPNDPNSQTAQGGGGSGGLVDNGQFGASPIAPIQQQLPGGTTTVTVTPINNTLPNPTVPVIPETNAPLPTVPLPIGTVNIIHGTDNSDDGITGNPPVLVGTAGNDRIYGHDGDDIIVSGSGGNDIYDGGNGKDTLTFAAMEGAANVNGVTFNLKAFTQVSTAQSAATGNDQFINIEKIVGSAGNDTFVLNDNTAWEIDAGAGVDTAQFANGLDLFNTPGGPEIKDFEIIDLATDTTSNSVNFDVRDFANVGNEVPLRLLGSNNDIVNLGNNYGLAGTWVQIKNDISADTIFTGGLTDGTLFDVYTWTFNGTTQTVYIEDGIVINLLPDFDYPSTNFYGNVNFNAFDGVESLKLTSGAIAEDNLEFYLGLAGDSNGSNVIDDLAPAGKAPTAGSAATFEFALNTGEGISTQWLFDANDYLPYDDFAFVTITFNGQVVFSDRLSSVGVVGNYNPSGWQPFNFTAQQSGVYEFSFGVMDVGDTVLMSDLHLKSPTISLAPVTENAAPLSLAEGFEDGDGGEGGPQTNPVLSTTHTIAFSDLDGSPFSDPEAEDSYTATAELTNANHLGSVSAEVYYGECGPEIILVYTVDNAAVQWLGQSETLYESIKVIVSDGGDQIEQYFNVAIHGVNDAPLISIANAIMEEEGSSTTLRGLSIMDIDAAPDELFDITVTAQAGTVSLVSAPPPLATLADVNATLQEGVVYTEPSPTEENCALVDTVTLTVTDSHGASDSMNFIFSIFGEADATLSGTQSKDALFSTAYNDTMTGDAGADIFVFGNDGAPGQDTVTDFIQGQDKIALYGLYQNYDHMNAAGALNNQNLGLNQIDLGGGNIITLHDVSVANLTEADFIFHHQSGSLIG